MKKITHTIKIAMTLISTLIIAGSLGCAKSGFQSSSSSATDPGSQDGLSAPLTSQPISDKIDVSSFISGGSYDKLQTVALDRVKKDLLLRMPLGTNIFITTGSGSVSTRYPDITFETEMSADGTAYITLRIPLKYVLRGVTGINPQRLPNGDPLPMIPSGELPSLGFTINNQNKVKLYVYLGVDIVGLYVESPFNPYIGITVPIKNQAGTKYVGYFSTVPAKSTFQGGFFLSFQLPPDLATLLDKYIFPAQ